MKRAEIVAEARTWIGTPFQHQGTLKGVGVDCRGILLGIAATFGIPAIDVLGYGREPNLRQMADALRSQLHEIPVVLAEAGDVIWMAFDRDPMHLAVLTDIGTIIHATTSVTPARVVEHGFRLPWTARARCAFMFPGVE